MIPKTFRCFAGFAALLIASAAIISYAEHKEIRYEGVVKCKNCHEDPSKGNQYMKWKESKHATAYQTLASEQSKEVASKLGIDDPQKHDKCLKCHTTVFGLPKERLGSKFKPENVQCEQCHGPGEAHVKARLDAAAADEENEDDLFGLEEGEQKRVKLPPGEIVLYMEEKTCTVCHNTESPTYKEFKFEEAKKEIAHPDPRPRSE